MMISLPLRRTRNFLFIALCLSLLIHLIGGALWAIFAPKLARVLPKPMTWASLQEPPPPQADVIRIERPVRAASRPAHENRVVPVAPHPQPVTTIAPAPSRPRHELAHVVKSAPAQAPPAAEKSVLAITPRREKRVAIAPVPGRKPAYSDRQIAQLGTQFSQTIADSRQTLQGVQAASETAPVVTMKHYAMHIEGYHEGPNPGDGVLTPVSWKRIGDTIWYRLRYLYVYPDGSTESDTIPWLCHYPAWNDPFDEKHAGIRMPIQPPPAGFKPDRPLKPILEVFFGGPSPYTE